MTDHELGTLMLAGALNKYSSRTGDWRNAQLGDMRKEDGFLNCWAERHHETRIAPYSMD